VAEDQVLEEGQAALALERGLQSPGQQQDQRDEPGPGLLLGRVEPRHVVGAGPCGLGCRGQGGWNDDIEFPEDLDEEIARAFDNVERTLATAGATWADVVEVDSYHLPDDPAYIGERPTRAMAEQFRKRMGDRAPIWTQIGVAALGAPGMRVEIRVTAIAGHAD
jgi:enamine deaminase RidA (YjgF/YER057c/UK114 family)